MTGPLVRPDWRSARLAAHAAAGALAPGNVALALATGRTLARDIRALSDVPHYSSSAMDGWAVAGDGPWMIVPTDSGPTPLAQGEARVIVTGGLVPDGVDRVLRSEDGRVTASPGSGETLTEHAASGTDGTPASTTDGTTASTPVSTPGGTLASKMVGALGGRMESTAGSRLESTPGSTPASELSSRQGSTAVDRPGRAPGGPVRRHIRPAGEEAQQGSVVLRAGTVLSPAHIAVAAACGHDDLPVRARARIALLLTGDEVQLAGIPAPGFVRDSFGVTLPAILASLGGDVVALSRVRDSLDDLVAALSGSAGASGAGPAPDAAGGADASGAPVDLVITTGSTGASAADHLHAALAAVGAELLVDRVAMRPGGPSLVARLPDGRLLLGLPGNPLAAITGLLALGHPLLAALAGDPLPAETSVATRDALVGRDGAALLSPYRLVDGRAVLNAFTGSAMMRGLAEADGILVAEPGGARPGDTVAALPLPWR